jgi:hypothetical protein
VDRGGGNGDHQGYKQCDLLNKRPMKQPEDASEDCGAHAHEQPNVILDPPPERISANDPEGERRGGG